MSTCSSEHIVLPNQTNPHHTLFGGVALAYMDEAAAIVAQRTAMGPVVTAHIDSVDFKAPIKMGEAVIVEARLVSVGRTSMQVTVDLYGEDLNTHTRKHCTTAKFVMVAVDSNGLPRPVHTIVGKGNEARVVCTPPPAATGDDDPEVATPSNLALAEAAHGYGSAPAPRKFPFCCGASPDDPDCCCGEPRAAKGDKS